MESLRRNQEFLDYITLCFGCIIDDKTYNILTDSDLNLRAHVKEFMGIFEEKNNYKDLIKVKVGRVGKHWES